RRAAKRRPLWVPDVPETDWQSSVIHPTEVAGSALQPHSLHAGAARGALRRPGRAGTVRRRPSGVPPKGPSPPADDAVTNSRTVPIANPDVARPGPVSNHLWRAIRRFVWRSSVSRYRTNCSGAALRPNSRSAGRLTAADGPDAVGGRAYLGLVASVSPR